MRCAAPTLAVAAAIGDLDGEASGEAADVALDATRAEVLGDRATASGNTEAGEQATSSTASDMAWTATVVASLGDVVILLIPVLSERAFHVQTACRIARPRRQAGARAALHKLSLRWPLPFRTCSHDTTAQTAQTLHVG